MNENQETAFENPAAVPTEPQEGNQSFCRSCGAPLSDGQAFCGRCGQGVASAAAPVADASTVVVKKKSKMPVIIGCVVGAVVIAASALTIVLLVGGKHDFNKEFSDIKYEKWCTIAEDGTWMMLDTNPTDMDSDDMNYTYYIETYGPCNEKIEEVNSELGFSSAVYKRMGETTWSQGRQTESNDKFTVSWTYHPDKGLEVMYEVKK